MPKPSAVLELQPYNDSLRTVRAVEIFRTGEWNGEEYSVSDLDEMVNAFNAKPYSVPLKIGHTESEGMPAFGWVDRLYRAGEVLIADFKDVPVWVFDMVFLQHSYDHVSVEIYFNLKVDGKTYKRALKAVALLGAETPAVSGLAPLRDAIFAPAADQYEQQVALSLKVAPMPEPVIKTPTPPVNPAPAPDPNAPDVAKLTTQIAQQNEAVAALQKLVKDQGDANTALLAQIATLAKSQQDAQVETKLIGVRLPAVKEHFRHLYDLAHAQASKVLKFKAADGKEADRTLLQLVDELRDQMNKFADGLANTNLRHRQPGGPSTLPAPVGQYSNAGEELAAAVQEHMSEKGLKGEAGYQAATVAVLKAKPDLAERYGQFARGMN